MEELKVWEYKILANALPLLSCCFLIAKPLLSRCLAISQPLLSLCLVFASHCLAIAQPLLSRCLAVAQQLISCCLAVAQPLLSPCLIWLNIFQMPKEANGISREFGKSFAWHHMSEMNLQSCFFLNIAINIVQIFLGKLDSKDILFYNMKNIITTYTCFRNMKNFHSFFVIL